MGTFVSNSFGKKHGSPASNLKPSMPYRVCKPFNPFKNHSRAFLLVKSIATTGVGCHHEKNPGFEWPGVNTFDLTKSVSYTHLTLPTKA